MSDTIQENTIVIAATTMETPVKKTRGRKAASEAKGGAGDKPVAKERPKKEKKAVPVSKTWNVPRRHDTDLNISAFLIHIHLLIKELCPELLNNSEIRDAYNNLRVFLSNYSHVDLVTFTPRPKNKYNIYSFKNE